MDNRHTRRRARATVDKTGDVLQNKAVRLIKRIEQAYRSTGIDTAKPEELAVALSATMTSAALVAVHAGMRQDEFVAYAEQQFEGVEARRQSEDDDEPS